MMFFAFVTAKLIRYETINSLHYLLVLPELFYIMGYQFMDQAEQHNCSYPV
ncbi:MAG: hypothetical protein K0R82_2956 [Flavipsychrobacter sp.]|jgi:hypothetical protein|nr:hypothetical protein [Flavipsychrobacter sp.]